MKKRTHRQIHFRSRPLARPRSGASMSITPASAGWELISFAVRTIARGDGWSSAYAKQERCLVLLSGRCRVEWRTRGGASGDGMLGPRASVFEAYPYALYVPAGSKVKVAADDMSVLADCRAPSDRQLEPQLVRPEDCGYEIRGGGNATRQIIDILPPSFPADRLMVCEVLTPAGNWSSYPPHKHDRDRPPIEADLEEIYYFRFRHPDGYGFHRVYTADGRHDETMTVRHGDLVVVREGYHPFVTAYGHDAYYLNVLAGTRRSMAATDDPRYAEFRRSWPTPDPRLPLIPRPHPVSL
jgi:5-deoxy-glucuronate isomerase